MSAVSSNIFRFPTSSAVCHSLYSLPILANNLTSLNPAADYFAVNQPSLSYRASSSILIKPSKRPNYGLSSFFLQAIDCGNSRSLILKQSKSLNILKYNLKSVDLSLFLKGSAFNMS